MNRLPGDRLGHGDMDEVAKFAGWAVVDVRGLRAHQVLAQLTDLASSRPGLAAQIVMALAAWVDPDEPADERTARLREIARNKENQ